MITIKLNVELHSIYRIYIIIENKEKYIII